MSVNEGLKMEGEKGTLTITWHIEKGRIELDDIKCSSDRLHYLNQAWLCANAGQNRCRLAMNDKLKNKFLEIFHDIRAECE